MSNIIQLALKILSNLTEMFDRETSADEKVKDYSLKSGKDLKKAVYYARIIFDGKRKFAGLDVLLKDKLSKNDYEEYLKLRRKFNKYS